MESLGQGGTGWDTERRLERYRDADRWPIEESLAAMLDNQQGAFVAVRNALPALAGAVHPPPRGSARPGG